MSAAVPIVVVARWRMQLLREDANRGQFIVGEEPLGGDEGFDLVDELQVDGEPVALVDGEQQHGKWPDPAPTVSKL